MHSCPAAPASSLIAYRCISSQRGHNREACFFGEDDYASYLRWLSEALAETECALHAYVLMTNQGK